MIADTALVLGITDRRVFEQAYHAKKYLSYKVMAYNHWIAWQQTQIIPGTVEEFCLKVLTNKEEAA